MQVTIIDTRPEWMRREDGQALCMRCPLYRRCASRLGVDCKRFGGSEIPKKRGGESMIKKRIFTEKPKIGSVEWQRMIIRQEARESLKKKKVSK